MKKLLIILTLSFFALPLRAEAALNQESDVTLEKKMSERHEPTVIAQSLGHLIVRHLVNPGFELDLDQVIKGIEDERAGIASPLTEEEYEQAIYALQEDLFAKIADENLAQATNFLKTNAVESGINIIEPKLQYRVVKSGEGEVVNEECTPLIHYKGSLLDGTVFANSTEGGANPINLPLKQTIPGFTRGLIGMKEGEKRTLYIHPELAYGLAGHLPPNSLLIFEVEILKANTATEEIATQESLSEDTIR